MNFINKTFNIKFSESNKVITIITLFFLSSFYMVNIEVLSQSLFNARVGVTLLPIMFIILAFTVFVTTFILFSLKLKNSRIFFVTLHLIVFVIHFLIFALIKIFNTKISIIIFYVTSQTVSTILFTTIWLIIQEVSDVESSKRLFPLASSGITLGFVVSGLFLKNTTQLIGVENTFLIGGFIIPATIYILNTLLKKHKVIYETKVETTTKIGETLNYIKNNNFYITVLIIGIIMPLIFFINDYLYNSMIKKSFIYEDKISSFFGLFYIVNGVISLFIRLFFISRIIIKLGVVRTTYLLILLFLSGILLMFSNSLISIFISKLLISIGLLTFGVSLFNLFYQVADLKYRYRVIVILETVGTSLGMLPDYLHSYQRKNSSQRDFNYFSDIFIGDYLYRLDN